MTSIKIIRQSAEMQQTAREWAFSTRATLVPTMGFLHDGHLSLVREAANLGEKVIVSIFVNPLQFGPTEDFEKYPRNMERDVEMLREVGATHVFMPEASDITPADMRIQVDPGIMGTVLCGKYRPGHFAGVCTIVMKLFQLTMPGTAIFGWKDAQQFLILSKMARDLNLPTALKAIETQREPDGLAMSSRNSYLTAAERRAAVAISGGLRCLREAYAAGLAETSELKKLFAAYIDQEGLLRLQYVEASRMDTLEPVDKVEPGNTLVAVAVYAGQTRLIDNVRL